MSIVGTEGLELGKVAEEVRKGAITAYEVTEKEKARKREEAKGKSWLQLNWKKVAGLGIGVTVIAGGAILGLKASKGFREKLETLTDVFGAPLKALTGLGDIFKGLPIPDLTEVFQGFESLPTVPKLVDWSGLTNIIESFKPVDPLAMGTTVIKTITEPFENLIGSFRETVSSVTDEEAEETKPLFALPEFDFSKLQLWT